MSGSGGGPEAVSTLPGTFLFFLIGNRRERKCLTVGRYEMRRNMFQGERGNF